MGWDMIDETAWKRKKKHCHSHTVGYGMRHDWWDCGKDIKQCHSLPVGHVMTHDLIDETVWQSNKAVSLTLCWSLDVTWLMRLPGKEIKQSVTHCLLVMGYQHKMILLWRNSAATHPLLAMRWNIMRMPGREQMWCYSLSVCWQQNYLGFNGRK